jgi:hypothetical protein
MILTLITIESPKKAKHFSKFENLAQSRYATYLSQEFASYDSTSWYTAVKPYHSGLFPFLVLDALIHFRGTPCHFFFGHDLLPFGSMTREELELDETVKHELESIVNRAPSPKSLMEFHGFGTRIDIGLNALGVLYMDILDSLTKVEADVLSTLRTLQFEKYADPMNVKTFGLQKRVAEMLGKSPVAVHKSLRSAKYPLLADTATAMKEMMV